MPPFAVLCFIAVQALLFPYVLNFLVLIWLSWRARRRGDARRAPLPTIPPLVTIQLPVYNESRVVSRLLDAMADLDYPRERLEVQVLDDSTDETTDLVAEGVRRLRTRGITASHVRRTSRAGFKAGALAAGLPLARGELIAIFDADAVPARDFLAKTVPRFTESRVGAVQTRLEYLNRSASFVAIGHSVMLDLGPEVESPARSATGLFTQFNGTGGVWRRAAIEDAGGWSADTITEDMDLTFRAQLRGWRLVYERDVVCRLEVTTSFSAFRSQQRRWCAGHMQTAVKLTPAVVRASLPAWTKYQALLFLTLPVAAVLTVVQLMLSAPIFRVHAYMAEAPTATALMAILGGPGIGPLAAAVYAQAVQGRVGRRRLLHVPAAMLVGLGILWEFSVAALGAVAGRHREFVRTPKAGDGRAAPERAPFPWSAVAELLLAAHCLWATWWHLSHGLLSVVPFVAFGGAAFLTVGGLSLLEFARTRLPRGRPGA